MNRFFMAIAMAGIWIVSALEDTAKAETPNRISVDSVMESDPSLAIPPPKIVFPKQLIPLWLKALAGPEADLQREVAQMLVRAHHRGMPGLKKTAGPLVKALLADDQRSVVRLAIARTLVVLNARTTAGSLFKLLDEEGLAFAQVVEPTLAVWDYQPIRKRWMARLDDTRSRHGLLQLAIHGLGHVHETKAAEPLWKLIQNRTARASLRLAAAKAFGRFQTSGLVIRAKILVADKTPRGIVDRLIAAYLLAHHSNEMSQQMLLGLAVDRQPAIAAVALKRLLQIDTALVIPLTVELLKNPDANVRMLAARALAAEPLKTSVTQLGTMLDDPHPDVRRFACSALFSYGSKADLKIAVRETVTHALDQQSWRGLEQAALLMGALDHKPANLRLIKLLESPREEVRIASAWALRKLAVASTLPAMLAHAIKITKKQTPDLIGQHDEQLVQLFQAFGQQKYNPALESLWRFIPKSASFAVRERVAAIWALGYIDLNGRQRELSGLLQGRLSDLSPVNPEDNNVRAMSAVTLGRTKAADAVPKLKAFYKSDTPNSKVGLACRWAILQITGENLPGPVPEVMVPGGWSLAPRPSPDTKKSEKKR